MLREGLQMASSFYGGCCETTNATLLIGLISHLSRLYAYHFRWALGAGCRASNTKSLRSCVEQVLCVEQSTGARQLFQTCLITLTPLLSWSWGKKKKKHLIQILWMLIAARAVTGQSQRTFGNWCMKM